MPAIRDAPGPLEHIEARDYLASLTAVTPEQLRHLEEGARYQAFWIAHAHDASLVQDVLDQIGEQLTTPRGQPWGEFQEALLERLEAEWAGRVGDPPRRMELITRNLANRSYNSGRWEQMNRPGPRQARPYRIFDAIVGDGRTTPICLAADGTVLPAGHPYWETHWPPLHHNCRSIVRSLSEEQVRDRGGPDREPPLEDPLIDPRPGFGLDPEVSGVWQPSEGEYSSEVWQALGKKLEGAPPVPGPKPAPAPLGPAGFWDDPTWIALHSAEERKWHQRSWKHGTPEEILEAAKDSPRLGVVVSESIDDPSRYRQTKAEINLHYDHERPDIRVKSFDYEWRHEFGHALDYRGIPVPSPSDPPFNSTSPCSSRPWTAIGSSSKGDLATGRSTRRIRPTRSIRRSLSVASRPLLIPTAWQLWTRRSVAL